MPLETEFEKADSRNIPIITEGMVANFFSSNASFISSELKQVKVQRSGRKGYGDFAVGFVKLNRFGNKCDIRASVTPEHRIHDRPYEVMLTIDEKEHNVDDFGCQCEANKGGCKHVTVFIFWLFRRNEIPASTEVECYWKTAPMTNAARKKGIVWATEMKATNKSKGSENPTTSQNSVSESDSESFQEIVGNTNTRQLDSTKKANISVKFALHPNCVDTNKPFGILKYLLPYDPVKMLSIDCMFISFKKSNPSSFGVHTFFEFCKTQMSDILVQTVTENTVEQHTCQDWYTYRIGRITASLCYEASRSNTYDGSLKERIMGFSSPIETSHMKRGKNLEKHVLNTVSKKYGKIFGSGLYLSALHPHLGATPDGIQDDKIFEVKCPSTMETLKKQYIDVPGNIKAKWIAQMQLQMHLCGRKKGVFCVAKPAFEKNQSIENIIIKEITYSDKYCANLIRKLTSFWEKSIYCLLKNQYLYQFK